MILHGVTLTNWRQHAASTVNFQRGLTGIIGPNGSGKSTVLEAVAWALFGAEAVRSTMATVKWHGAPKTQKASVVLDFSVGGNQYLLTRTEDSAKLEAVAVDGGDYTIVGETVAATPSAVKAFIAQLLGLSFQEFSATYLSEQKDVMRLQQMGPEDRRKFMRRVLGVGRLDDGVKAAGESARVMEKGLLEAHAGIGPREPKEAALADAQEAEHLATEALIAANEVEAEARARHTRAHFLLERSTLQKAEHDRLTREIEAAERDALSAGREVERLTAEVEECRAAGERLRALEPELAKLPESRAERDRMLEQKRTAETVAHLQDEIRQEQERRDDAQNQIGFYDAEAHSRDTAACTERSTAMDAARLERDKARAANSSEQTAVAHEKHKLQLRIKALEHTTDATCPTCKQALGDRLDGLLAEMRAEVGALEARAEKLVAEYAAIQPTEADRQLEHEVRELAATCARHQILEHDAQHAAKVVADATARIEATSARLSTLTAIPFDANAFMELEAAIHVLERAEQQAAVERAKVERMPALEAEIGERKRDLLHGIGPQRFELDLARSEIAFDPAAHAELASAAETARSAREEATAARARCDGALQAASEAEAKARAALEQYDRDAAGLADAEGALRVEQRAADRLRALRTSFVQTIRPELEDLVSGFVATLTDGRYESAAINEDFGVTLYRGGIAVDVASGGEEDVVAIALRLATSLMIAERAGHSLQCVILDEPFGSLDAVRRRNVLELLTHRLKGLFEQVIVISHFEDVEQAVEHAVVVDYDDARATSTVRSLALANAA